MPMKNQYFLTTYYSYEHITRVLIKAKGLASSLHRAEMCRLSILSSKWIMMDDWETLSKEYVPTIKVINHIYECLHNIIPG